MKTIKQLIYPALIIIIAMTACSNANRQAGTESQTAADDTTGHAANNKASVHDSISDSIPDAFMTYTGDSLFTVKLLETGSFHSDEVWAGASKEQWFGLFKDKGGYYLAETKIKTKRVHDDLADDAENEKTGWLVTTLNKDTCSLLIEALPFLSGHRIDSVSLAKYIIWPGNALHFKYMGVDYELFATGEKRKIDQEGEWYEVWNYKLYLAAQKNGQKIKDLIISQSRFDDHMTAILFAGDIDGDGFLDLIIDGSNHYNVLAPMLFLSKPARKGKLLQYMGSHVTVGC